MEEATDFGTQTGRRLFALLELLRADQSAMKTGKRDDAPYAELIATVSQVSQSLAARVEAESPGSVSCGEDSSKEKQNG
jgi:hypothetical protein